MAGPQIFNILDKNITLKVFRIQNAENFTESKNTYFRPFLSYNCQKILSGAPRGPPRVQKWWYCGCFLINLAYLLEYNLHSRSRNTMDKGVLSNFCKIILRGPQRAPTSAKMVVFSIFLINRRLLVRIQIALKMQKYKGPRSVKQFCKIIFKGPRGPPHVQKWSYFLCFLINRRLFEIYWHSKTEIWWTKEF